MIRVVFIFICVVASLSSYAMGKYACRKRFFDTHRLKSDAGEVIRPSFDNYLTNQGGNPPPQPRKTTPRGSFHNKKR